MPLSDELSARKITRGALVGSAGGGGGGSFSTSFTTDENPLSGGGSWQTTDASNFDPWKLSVSGDNVPFTTGGRVFSSAGATGFDDCIAFLKPSVGIKSNTQTVTATYYSDGSGHGSSEIELHLCSSWTSSTVKTYEFLFLPDLAGGICTLHRWNGTQGDLDNGGTPLISDQAITMVNGDTIECSMTALSGGSRTLVCKRNGVQVFSFTDTAALTETNASCGIGFDNPNATPPHYGWADFAVVST